MSLGMQKTHIEPIHLNYENLKSHWLLGLILGVVLIVLGTAALSYAFLATLVAVKILSVMLIIGGISQMIVSFQIHKWSGFLSLLLVGALYLIVGILTIVDPLETATDLTLLIACFLIFGGTYRIILAITTPLPHRVWILVNGVITLALGVMVWRHWPSDSFNIIGIFLGVDLIFNGWAWVMLSLRLKSLPLPGDKTVVPAV